MNTFIENNYAIACGSDVLIFVTWITKGGRHIPILSSSEKDERSLKDSKISAQKQLKAGKNESYLVEFEDGSEGIFKPRDGEVSDMRLGVENGTYFIREAAAYELSKDMGWDFIPATIIREHNGKTGSLQKWVDGANQDPKGLPIAELEKVGVFDYLINNTDRHYGNFLVKDKKLIGIDHGLSFSDNFHEFNSWIYDELIDKPISPAIKQTISKLTDEKIDTFVRNFNFDESVGKVVKNRRDKILSWETYQYSLGIYDR